jgi:hypothetical protein
MPRSIESALCGIPFAVDRCNDFGTTHAVGSRDGVVPLLELQLITRERRRAQVEISPRQDAERFRWEQMLQNVSRAHMRPSMRLMLDALK